MGLVANALEGAAISTVLSTTRPDVTQEVGTPRAIFVRFPLGNSCGEPGRPDQQRTIIRAALDALRELTGPGHIMETPFRWRRM